jgi:hypothetical protein
MSFLDAQKALTSIQVRALPSWTAVMGLALIAVMWVSLAISDRMTRSIFTLLTGVGGLTVINLAAGYPARTFLWAIFNVSLLRQPAARELIWRRVTDIGSLGSLLFLLAALGIQTLAVWTLLPRKQPDLLISPWNSSRSRMSSVAQIASLLLLFVSIGFLNSSLLTWVWSVLPRG